MKNIPKRMLPEKLPIGFILINLFFIILFSVIFFWFSGIKGEDLFFHLKIASLIKHNGFSIIQDMRWFQLTTWSQTPADLSMGFHLLLIPLLTMFEPIVAIKLLGIGLILLLINVFYRILKTENVDFKPFWIFLLMFISTFLFYRLSLIRPFIVSISFSLLLFYSIVRNRLFLFGFISLIYPLFYSGWIQIYILLFFFFIAEYIVIKKIPNLKLILVAAACISFGFILRPDFPNILVLTYQQVVDLLFINLKGIDINVGTGQRNANFYFFQDNIIGIILMTYALMINFFNFKYLRDEAKKIILLTLSLITLFYFLWSLESVRFIEYWLPFTILLSAITYTYYSSLKISAPHWSIRFVSSMIYKIKNRSFWKIIFIIFLLSISFHGPWYVLKNIKYAKPVTAFKKEALWLAENTPDNSNVFIVSWDSFSRLFFYNDHNNYTVGMDPVFFYIRDPDRFRLWRNITEHVCASSESSEDCPDALSDPVTIARTIRSQFNSDYIISNNYSVYYPFVMMMANHPEIYQFIMSGENSFLFRINPSIQKSIGD